MFAFLLGLTWLVLTPVCVWLLFGRGNAGTRRATGALTLAALQICTIVVGLTGEAAAPEGTRETAAAEAARETMAGHGAPAAPAALPPGAVAGQSALPPGAVAGQAAPGAPGCASRIPMPESVRLSRHGGLVDGVTVSWPAASGECGTATIALHHSGRRLRIWLQEGAPHRHHEGTQDVPVSVARGRASLDLRLTPPLRHHRRYVAVNGHTGHHIPVKW
ncbi:hypothetical protein [Microbispora sp. NPDC049125]|uniref:hypothetical protein n=1 Tax=Microbispora sp. NPDC049125 TaxID=3154929 RepID=UPI003465DB72